MDKTKKEILIKKVSDILDSLTSESGSYQRELATDIIKLLDKEL